MKLIFTLFSVVLLVFSGMSQGKGKNQHPKKEEIQAQKVAFISNELDLSKEEAEKFWPIYNEYDAKMREIHRAHKSNVRKLTELKSSKRSLK